jgi:hypothetical protein
MMAWLRWCASAVGLAVLFVLGCWQLKAVGEFLRGERR